MRFLLGANLSPKTAAFLRRNGHNVKSITENRLGYLSDEDIAELAFREKRIVISFDQDFGEIYHNMNSKNIGIIVLRIKNQTVESVNRVLSDFLSLYEQRLLKSKKSLVVIRDNSLRVID